MKREDLLKIINDDDLGLLNIKTSKSSPATSDERLVSSFLEINNFIKEHNHEPNQGGEIKEHLLASRLFSLRQDKNKAKILTDYDEFNLLNIPTKEIKSIADIFADDDIGVLDNIDRGLFKIKNIPKQISRTSAEYIARRRPCKEFIKFESLFSDCQRGLKNGTLRLRRLERHRQLQKGSFFVLGGILGFIDKVGTLEINDQKKLNGRLRIIFENGTESNMLLQSLVKALQDYSGWIVREKSREIVELPQEEDKQTGYIYIVKSLSSDPQIQSYSNLFKIGFSTIPIEERVKNSSKDPTFLMAPVKIITTFECYNFNPQKLEQLLHSFFGSSCLNIDIYDDSGKRFVPREWFIAPLEVIEQAVSLIINGGILNYRYDVENQQIVLR